MNRLTLIAAIVLAASTTAASAYDYGRRERIDERQAEQAGRIKHDRANGNLTWFERQKLLREERQIAHMEAYAKRDGYVSRREARDINEALNEASRDIHHESHDGQQAWWRRVWW